MQYSPIIKNFFLYSNVFGRSELAFASLESLGQDKTFKSLESLVRLFPKVSKVIIFFFWMHKNGWEDQNCYRFLKYDLLE